MNEFIEKIIELDGMTSSLDKEYKEKEAMHHKSYKNEKANYEKKLQDSLDARISKYKEKADKEYEQKAKEFDENLRKKINLIMERYEFEKPGIVDYITQIVLERDNEDGRS